MGRGKYELWTQTSLISRNQNLYHGGRCLYGYPSRGHVDFQKGQFSRSINRRSQLFRKLQFYPRIGHRASSRVYFTTSYLLLQFCLSMRRLVALFSYRPSGTSKTPYSSSQHHLSQSTRFSLTSQHRLSRVKSNRRRYRLSYCGISPNHTCERDRPWVVTTAGSCR